MQAPVIPQANPSTLYTAATNVGIIFPPSDVRGIADKTAQFVAKNGPEFEQRVLADQNNAQKFSFLLPGNPYRAYYDAKVKEFQTGEVNEATQQQIPEAIKQRQQREVEKKQKKEELLALTATYPTQPSPIVHENVQGQILAIEDERQPEPPSEDQFTVGHPYAAALDIDVIKLTAQYVARNGQRFLVGLGQRERGNPQFAFLRATHPLFAYFTSLVDSYSKSLLPEKATVSRLKDDVGISGKIGDGSINALSDVKLVDGVLNIPKRRYNALFNILHRVHERQRWEAFEEKQKEEKERREAEERESMQAMDWHEFTVVECIDFTEEDDHLPLGAPIDKSTLLQPKPIAPLASSTVLPSASVAAEIEAAIGAEGMALLKEDLEVTEMKEAEPAPVLPMTEPTPPPLASTTASAPPTSVPETAAANAPLVVVKDYVRQGKKRGRADLGLQRCPLTGQMVPTEQMTEHLRIVLLDPKWKEQKDSVLEKAKRESALADTEEFGMNLAEFVVNRPDLFGTVEDEVESAYIPVPKQRKE